MLVRMRSGSILERSFSIASSEPNLFRSVDAVFGPVFRYFDVFDTFVDLGVFDTTPKLRAWRRALARRASVRDAVMPDYAERLRAFLRARGSALSALLPPPA